ncbi:RNA-binding protein, CCR4-NOT complex subunit Rcd1 [Coemansia sp. RSA 2671]|uniref:RNA-binding protein, CCR4-NOT complex subunit Rcd1 n=3 Tax=Coemansia TaxID=4863 RepID=A0A9W8GE62_9FUNG|nr:RNA-binding protein, CCR4-NOT complex subunit Rcd1 [Coemansia sp. RSA 2675]KAJ2346080.1 RNA-binding protein, CCR4-NOT complex subunit Rcd1 [Coemansia sp. RSA 2671]KAJ2682441.1 RNA-binding protein, CCR4-NOT complex subunit Rcd1 [Coemansia spiralis]
MSQGTAAAGSQATSGHSAQNYHYMQQQQSNMAQSKGLDATNYQNQALYARLGNPQTNAPASAAAMYGNPSSGASLGQGAGNNVVGHNMATGGGSVAVSGDNETLYQLMVELFSATNREQALAELSRRRDQNTDLGVALWNAYGVMTILYQEIIAIYPLLNPPALTMPVSNRACNSLALLQLVATHEQTRMQLLKANVPQLLYPFLSTTSKAKQYDNLRLTSLGVIGALVKYDNHEVINFFVSTEFLPLCLKIMDIGSELCKVVATFIFQKIILDDGGFNYVTSHPKRLHTVLVILNNVINQMVVAPSGRLLKSVTKCLIRLADNPKACEEMREGVSENLRDSTFAQVLAEDVSYRRLVYQLIIKLS